MNELMNTAVELMFLGMGTVFVFLVVLILATQGMSSVLMRMAANQKTEVQPSIAPRNRGGAPVKDQALLKAISEAIKQHRSN